MQCDFGAAVFHDRGYWAVEFSVAAEELGGASIKSDSIWSMVVIRARIGPASEQCVCWPLYGQAHNHAFYPLAVFEDAPAE